MCVSLSLSRCVRVCVYVCDTHRERESERVCESVWGGGGEKERGREGRTDIFNLS